MGETGANTAVIEDTLFGEAAVRQASAAPGPDEFCYCTCGCRTQTTKVNNADVTAANFAASAPPI